MWYDNMFPSRIIVGVSIEDEMLVEHTPQSGGILFGLEVISYLE